MAATKAKGTTNIPPGLGAAMRTWREHAKKSLEEVAKAIGTKKGHLSEVETEQGNLSLPLFIKYCKAIQTPASKILGDGVMPKDRDVERLGHEVAKRHTVQFLQWLSTLTREEGRAAWEVAKKEVDYERLRRDRIRRKRPEDVGAPPRELNRKT